MQQQIYFFGNKGFDLIVLHIHIVKWCCYCIIVAIRSVETKTRAQIEFPGNPESQEELYHWISQQNISLHKALSVMSHCSRGVEPVCFDTMTRGLRRVRRLSTVSSVLQPNFILTTEWAWFWEDEFGNWIQYASAVREKSMAIIILVLWMQWLLYFSA